MQHDFWNDYFSWGGLLCCGVLILFFSSFGNWRHSCSARWKHGLLLNKQKLDILDQRQASGETAREPFGQMKLDPAKA